MSNIAKILTNHNDFNSAYIIEDYPYGFLRTKKAMWIESNKKGDRLCYATLNPKNNKWNKPKTSTYSAIITLYITNDTGYVEYMTLSDYSTYLETNNYLNTIGQTTINTLNQFQKQRIKNLLGDYTPNLVIDSFTGETIKEKQYTIKWAKNYNNSKTIALEVRFNTTGGITLKAILEALKGIKNREKVLDMFDNGNVRAFAKSALLGNINKDTFLDYISSDEVIINEDSI